MKSITEASLKNLNRRLVEIGLLPRNAGKVKLTSLPTGLQDALKRVADGALMIVHDKLLLNVWPVFKIITVKNQEIQEHYVFPRDHQ